MGKKKKHKLRNIFYFLTSLAIVGVGWELCSFLNLIPSSLLPPPHIFLPEICNLNNFQLSKLQYAQSAPQWYVVIAIFSSSSRVVLGLVVGFLIGFPVGMIISSVQLFKNFLLPLVTFLAPLSPIAWLPFALIFLGTGDLAAIFIVFVSVVFLLIIATVNAVNNLDDNLVKAAKSLGANKFQTIWHVVIPGILPSVFVILRINFFAAWMAILVAEMIGVSSGLGAVIQTARALFNVKLILLSMTLVALTGFMLDGILRIIQNKLLWWRTEVSVKTI